MPQMSNHYFSDPSALTLLSDPTQDPIQRFKHSITSQTDFFTSPTGLMSKVEFTLNGFRIKRLFLSDGLFTRILVISVKNGAGNK